MFGLFGTPSGLGVAAANTVSVLRARGERVATFDVRSDGAVAAFDDGDGGPKGVNLFHLNPNWLLPMLLAPDARRLHLERRLNACVTFWELPRVTASWIQLLDAMDVVLAPSAFVKEALVGSGLRTPIIDLPQAAFLPDVVAEDRTRFGIKPDAFAIAMSFATGSLIARKNPWASVGAFQLAFAEERDAQLVVRVLEDGSLAATSLLEGLRRAAAADSRIVVVEGDLDYRGVLSLYASCDAYMSLHRAEGLGLGPMEAMSLGKPVVATGWSGNMDFMTEDNSCLVTYRLVASDLGTGTPYGADIEAGGVEWAEPDVDSAAGHLRRLYEQPELRASIGATAARDMDARRAAVLEARFLVGLRDAHEGLPRSREHREKARYLRGLRRQHVRESGVHRAKVEAVRVARWLHLKRPAPPESP